MIRQPLHGLRVLDFSTLLPGPLCSLLLAEAGAEVVKIERPGSGDEMRSYVPKLGSDSVNFASLNRGKRSVTLDLKSKEGREKAVILARESDIVIEQFRPGVMARLGLGYEDLRAGKPRIIYCSISGYGQSGPMANIAAHDLNYLAEAGMLGLTAGIDGSPVLPPALIADIGGGAYPAVMNILLAVMQRDRTGDGCHLDVSMADNLFTFMYWGLGNGWAAQHWPGPGDALVTGGSLATTSTARRTTNSLLPLRSSRSSGRTSSASSKRPNCSTTARTPGHDPRRGEDHRHSACPRVGATVRWRRCVRRRREVSPGSSRERPLRRTWSVPAPHPARRATHSGVAHADRPRFSYTR
jgi:hypothetical protein